MKYVLHRQYQLLLDVKIKAANIDKATDILWTNRIVPKDVVCSITCSNSRALRYDIENWGYPCQKINEFCYVNAISHTFLTAEFEASDDEEAMKAAKAANFEIKSYEFLNNELEADLSDFEAKFTVGEPTTSIKLYKLNNTGKMIEVEFSKTINRDYLETILNDAYNSLYHFGACDVAYEFRLEVQDVLDKIDSTKSINEKTNILNDFKQSLSNYDIYTDDMKKVIRNIEKYIESN